MAGCPQITNSGWVLSGGVNSVKTSCAVLLTKQPNSNSQLKSNFLVSIVGDNIYKYTVNQLNVLLGQLPKIEGKGGNAISNSIKNEHWLLLPLSSVAVKVISWIPVSVKRVSVIGL